MPVAARRVFRLSLTVALALAVAYGSGQPMPYIAPIFAFMLGAPPRPPMGPKGLLGLMLVLIATLGSGLLVLPAIVHYPVAGLLLVLLGLFAANYVSLNLGKAAAGLLLAVGLTLITALGTLGSAISLLVIQALCLNIALAVVCQWAIYPLFPEQGQSPAPPPPPPPAQSGRLALRATLIVFPAYLLLLSNPTAYAPVVMKSVALGSQASAVDARAAGRELIGSTVMAALLALLMWLGLKLAPGLWLFTLWTLLFSGYVIGKFYRVLPSRYPPSFWQNVLVTLFILIGPAVGDTESGKDPYQASAVRIGLFLLVTVYAWLMVLSLERLRAFLAARDKGEDNVCQAT